MVFFSLDPAADGYGLGCCVVCAEPASAAVMMRGVVAFACRRHTAQVDRAMLEQAVSPIPEAV